MRYGGSSYQKISKELGGEFTVSTLRKYFSRGGRLYYSYQGYADDQGAARKRHAILLLKSASQKAAKALLRVLDKAVEEGDSNLILKSAQIVLDRAGVPAAKRVEFDTDLKTEEDDDIETVRRRLLDAGIDPDSIKYVSNAPPRTQGSLPD